MSTDDWQSALIPIFGGLNADELFPVVNLVIPAYLLLAFFPRWKHTHTVALITAAFYGVVYLMSLIAINTGGEQPEGDFGSLGGLMKLFRNPTVMFAGWVHYIAFDLLVSRGVSLDALDRGASTMVYTVVVVPCMFGCLMFGPVGYIVYLSLRPIVLPLAKPKSE